MVDTAPATASPGADGAPVLACSGLRKAYGERVAVDGVGFEIARGETYGLVGPNGAGRTTTVSMVCGLLEPDAGEVTVVGRPMSPRATDAKAAIGFVPHDVALYDDLSADGADVTRRVAEVLELVGLPVRATDKVEHDSTA